VFPDIESKKLEFFDGSHSVSSPGLTNKGNGTIQSEVISDHHKLGLQRPAIRERFNGEGFLLSLENLWSGTQEKFWMDLTEGLKDRGLSEEKIAIICAAVRKEIEHLNRETTEELAEILRRYLSG